MNKIAICIYLCLAVLSGTAQPPTKTPSQGDINKMIEDALKQSNMSKEEMDQAKKMMNEVLPDMMSNKFFNAAYPAFTSNKQLVPQKNIAKINLLPKKKFIQADVITSINLMYSKIMVNGTGTEIALIKKVLSKFTTPAQIEGAAIIAMFQGHPEAAMAFSMKAVMAEPGNGNYQNNTAALLTQYGFPEKSVPILQKLRTEFPGNSTVLTNLAYAWLGLGQTDSARNIIRMVAGGRGTGNPEAKLCGGLMDEISGDPFKATEQYAESMAEAINPFTENVAKNAGGKNKIDALDFDKIKEIITIYEYFPKNWIVIPKNSNDVANYNYERARQRGYDQMMQSLENNLALMIEDSQKEIDAMMAKDEKEMIKTMMKEGTKGYNMMSMAAVSIIKILTNYLLAWSIDKTNELNKLNSMVDGKRKQMEQIKTDGKCPAENSKRNAFMSAVNPAIWEFHTRRTEEFRNWLNAFLTWSWYVAGNPKNIVMSQCLEYTKAYLADFRSAISDMQLQAYCMGKANDDVENIAVPSIPNFTCPVVVKMPAGPDWQALNNASANFNKNIYEILKDPTALVPNVTVGFGSGKGSIAEPGVHPYVKSGNGTMNAGLINYYKGPWDRLPAYADDELLPSLVSEEQIKQNQIRSLLKKMMTADCNGDYKTDEEKLKEEIEKRKKDPKELDEYERLKEQLKELRDKLTEQKATKELEEMIVKIDELVKEAASIREYQDVSNYKKNLERALEPMDKSDPKNDKNDLRSAKKVVMQTISSMEASGALHQISLYGISPTICSGLQAAGMYNIAAGLYR